MQRLVCTDSFAGEKGNVVPVSHYGLPGDWPLELLVTVASDENEGKTTMTLHHEGLPAGTMSNNTESGWSESVDKLDESLK